MIKQDEKGLEIALNDYIELKRNQAECTGFIDGFEKAIKYLREEQKLPIDLVSKSFTEKQMDDAYDKGYSDGLANRAC